jgi:tetratricopeptide (TPR) repeat protein
MKNIVFFFILLSYVTVFAQKNAKYDSSAIKLFNKGLDYYTDGKDDSALAIWTRIINKKIGIKEQVYGNALFNIPTIYWKKGQLGKAKEGYEKVIAADLKDSASTGDPEDPHTNYKHKSAMALAGLCAIDSSYTETLKWLALADTQYRFWGFEGSSSSVAEEEASIVSGETDALLKLKKREEAIYVILGHLICTNLEQEFEVPESRLLSLVDHKSFKAGLDKALNAVVVENTSPDNWLAVFTFQGFSYRIPISKIYPDKNIPHYHQTIYAGKMQDINKKYFIDYISKRSFYKALSN